MKFLFTVVPAILLAGAIGAAATPAMAQGAPKVTAPRAAGSRPGPSHERLQFQAYLEKNPAILNELEKDPSLINNPEFLKKHEDLRLLVNRSPGLKRRLKEDPERAIRHTSSRIRHHERYERQPQTEGGTAPGMGGGMAPNR